MVILWLLLSLPIETAIMEVLFREMMLASISGWITLWIDPKIYAEMFGAGILTYAVIAVSIGRLNSSQRMTTREVDRI